MIIYETEISKKLLKNTNCYNDLISTIIFMELKKEKKMIIVSDEF